MTRGDIYWLKQGSKRRPVAVMTRNTIIPFLSHVVVVPATTRSRGIASEVVLTKTDGMPQQCVLLADQVQVIPKRMLGKRITTLSQSRLDELCDAMSYALGC